MEEESYISVHPLGHTRPVTGSLCLTIVKQGKFMELTVQQPDSCRLHLLNSNVRMLFTNSLSDAAMECMKTQVNCVLSYKGNVFVI